MFLLLGSAAVIALCVLLWRVAVYALPVFVGLSTGWWALKEGAGFGCVVVGLFAAVIIFLVGQAAATGNNRRLRCVAIAIFVAPAALVGFNMVSELAQSVSPIWRYLFASAAAIAVGGTTYARLTASDLHQSALTKWSQ